MVKRSLMGTWLVLGLWLWSPAQGGGGALIEFDPASGALTDYVGKGKWVVVMFWAADCHVCEEEAPAFSAFHDDHRERDAVVLGVNLDGVEGRAAARRFIDAHGLSFNSLLTEPSEGVSLYEGLVKRRWVGTPSFLVFHPDGRLLAQQVGAVEIEIIEAFMRDHRRG